MRDPLSILAVDDDDVESELIERTFRKAPFIREVVRARDGVEGLKILQGCHEKVITAPFLLLLDLNMPRLSGLEFLRELRADPALSGTIVFVLTSSNLAQDRSAAYASNVSGYVVKSGSGSNVQELHDLIESYWKVVEFPHPEESVGERANG